MDKSERWFHIYRGPFGKAQVEEFSSSEELDRWRNLVGNYHTTGYTPIIDVKLQVGKEGQSS